MSNSGAGAVGVAVLMADFVSGVVHWAEDAYARFKPQRKLPLINTIALDNDLHHRRPRDFLARSWWASSWDLALIGLALLAAAQAFGFLSCALLVFVVLTVNANQMHKWTHRNPRENPWWVTQLQRVYVLQTPRHHGRHHSGEKNSHYCVVTNFLNPLLEEVSFWRRLERGVDRLRGRAPAASHRRS
ncbi:MAG: fatty acid desaturase CarF family protein [Burkholderiales bacterium]